MNTDLAFRGVPSFFRHACHGAARQTNRLDYANAGYSLAGGLQKIEPLHVSTEEWTTAVDELKLMLEKLNWQGALQWFVRWFPECMALVPPRRERKFIEGVLRDHLENCGCTREEAFTLSSDMLNGEPGALAFWSETT